LQSSLPPPLPREQDPSTAVALEVWACGRHSYTSLMCQSTQRRNQRGPWSSRVVTPSGRDSVAPGPGDSSPGTHCSLRSECTRGPFIFPRAESVCGGPDLSAGPTEDRPEPLQGKKRMKHLEGKVRDGTGHGHCVSLGCRNKTLQMGSVNNRTFFCTAPEAGSPRLRCPQGWGLVSALSLATFLLCPHVAFLGAHLRGEREICCLFLFLLGHQSYGIRLHLYHLISPFSLFLSAVTLGMRTLTGICGDVIQSMIAVELPHPEQEPPIGAPQKGCSTHPGSHPQTLAWPARTPAQGACATSRFSQRSCWTLNSPHPWVPGLAQTGT